MLQKQSLRQQCNLPRRMENDMVYLAALLHDIGKPEAQCRGKREGRTGELRTEDTPEEYFQEKLYGARDVEYTVCALVELPYSMSYRYGGIGYEAVLSVERSTKTN